MKYFLFLFLSACSSQEMQTCKVKEVGECYFLISDKMCPVICEDGRGLHLFRPMKGGIYKK